MTAVVDGVSRTAAAGMSGGVGAGGTPQDGTYQGPERREQGRATRDRGVRRRSRPGAGEGARGDRPRARELLSQTLLLDGFPEATAGAQIGGHDRGGDARADDQEPGGLSPRLPAVLPADAAEP